MIADSSDCPSPQTSNEVIESLQDSSQTIEDTPPSDLEQLLPDSSQPQPDGSGQPETQQTPPTLPQTQSEAQGVSATPAGPGEDFPLENLQRLDEQLNRPKWVVPVRPDDDLEKLLKASIRLCREGLHININPLVPTRINPLPTNDAYKHHELP